MTVLINEFQPNPFGGDPATTTFELTGTPGEFFEGTILSIESDGGDGSGPVGTIDRATNVSGTFDANGLLVVEVPDLENPSFTVMLVQGFTGAIGDDIDPDDDGVADNFSNLGTVIDAIGVPDSADDEDDLFAAQFGGTDLAFTGAEPQLIFRDGASGDLYAVNEVGTASTDVFNASGVNVGTEIFDTDPTAATSFGAVNPVATAPEADFTLQILHASDLEGGVDAIANAPNFAAIVDAFEQEAAADGYSSILLSAGDNYIPGPFFAAGGDFGLGGTFEGFYNAFFGLIDESVLDPSADTNGDGFFDNSEIQAVIAADGSTLTFDDVYTTDVNGDGFKDYFEEIDASEGRLDVAIVNAIGFDASAVGNHEFDAGTDAFENAINYDSEEGNSLSDGRYGTPNYLQEVDTPGVQFPYLSANLDFSGDSDVGALFQDNILVSTEFQSDLLSAREPLPGSEGDFPAVFETAGDVPDSNDQKLAPATVIEVDGERIGVVGATTQVVSTISSTGAIEDATSPGVEDMEALAAALQPYVDDLTADGVNKIILVSHLQQFALEVELAGLLEDVDVIIAGGSDAISADGTDRLRTGDIADQPYPAYVTNASGTQTAIVSTDGEYTYVGRLVIDFDADGNIIPTSVDEDVSGAYATDDQGVADVWSDLLGAPTTAEDARAASDSATDVENLTGEVTAIVTELDADVAGEAAVYLNGERSDVRTQETNLGNLTADANLVAAQEIDPEVVISLKNGGGIRASIGTILENGDRTITEANALSGKEEGEISELDIDNVLRFDNELVLLDLSPADVLAVLEHAVARTEPGATPGQFPQVGGLQFSFDPSQPSGARVQNVWLIDAEGNPTVQLVEDGVVVDGAPVSLRVVTLDFLVGDPTEDTTGGDGYPFPALGENFVFTEIGEQKALSDYLTDNFPAQDGNVPVIGPDAFSIADTDAAEDTRIQNLAVREDTVGQSEADAPTAPDAPEATGVLAATIVAELDGGGGRDGAEVVAHEDGKLYVTNGSFDTIDVFDLATPEADPQRIDLTLLDDYAGVQSVAIANGLIAVAVARDDVDGLSQPGFVAFYEAGSLDFLGRVDVGNLPDQLTFNADGTSLLVAGEGEFNADNIEDGRTDNPLGTVAVITPDLSDLNASAVQLLDFTGFDGSEADLRLDGVRISEGIDFSLDAEPEYVAVTADGTTAFVSLQENNAIAKIDLTNNTVTEVFSLGVVDFSQPGQEIDANDNGIIQIKNFDNLVGFRMADAIDTFEVDGQTFVITANEGDSRDFDEDRVGDLAEDGLLAPSVDPTGLERLEVSTVDGLNDDGLIETIHSFSSRSFSIFDGDGNLVFDSGSEFEAILAEVAPERFNDDDGDDGEDRSDAKGPEPEAVTIGSVAGVTYAFIGLERDSGIMIYDVSDPANSEFVTYIPPLHVDNAGADEVAKHGPEIIAFIDAADSLTGNAQIAVSYEISGTTIVYDLVDTTLTPIYDIQGAGHVSAFVGEEVTTTGIVTAVDFNGYYLQDLNGDGNDATSDAIFVFTDSGNTGGISVGDEVRVTGSVSEFIPGGAGTGNLSTTQIRDSGAVSTHIISSGNDLPEAVILGEAGRNPPTDVVISEDELPVNLQTVPGTFNPDVDGIDFYESLEGMRVTVDTPVAISTTNRFNETWVVADEGANVTGGSSDGGLTDRSGLIINADQDGYGDLNPERIQLQYDRDLLPEGFDAPDVTQGDTLSDVTGVFSYAFGNYEILVTEAFDIESASTNVAEVTELVTPDVNFPGGGSGVEKGNGFPGKGKGLNKNGDGFPGKGKGVDKFSDDFPGGPEDGSGGKLTVATYNVLNLTSNFNSGDRNDEDADQLMLLAEQIVNNLGTPDILALQEIQDDSGVNFGADDGVLGADATLQALVDAIVELGGPEYEFASAIVDEAGETGGVPGGNIRNAFLWNPERVDAEEIVTLESAVLEDFGVTNPEAFNEAEARDPLLGVFTFNGEEITLINNHFESRSGSEPVFGGPQPFDQNGEEARAAQSQAINEVMDALLAENPDAKIVTLGDFNTFEFTDELDLILEGEGADQVLTNLVEIAEADDAFTFNFQGNMQNLDHIFVTESLLEDAEVDYVHVNTDVAEPASDHDPILAMFDFTDSFDFV